ncbi:MAG: exo-alpha-sialidase [Acidobacteria bacterium]|nr:exo-alpha-sialidase [Acidobacteriota bacterium]
MNAQLTHLQKIWDKAPHNALTDLIRFQNCWYCTFREGTSHLSLDGKIRILVTDNATSWISCALLEIPGIDLRDPKLQITPSGRLMLNACAAFSPGSSRRHQSLVWFSSDGHKWSDPAEIGHPDFWLWRTTWHKQFCYGVAYSTSDPLRTRLYSSSDGIRFNLVVEDLFAEDFPNEAALLFQKDDIALCLLRRDSGKATAMLGSSVFPYRNWIWKDLGLRIGGPNMLLMPDGRIVAAVRRYCKEPWTSLNWLDPVAGRLDEFLALPSGGDTSYAGLSWHENQLWISYYSSHEQGTNIYLARVKPPAI